ncbi:hypothetical protein KUCAC02_011705, partial [Chaenocephalus aceratus]
FQKLPGVCVCEHRQAQQWFPLSLIAVFTAMSPCRAFSPTPLLPRQQLLSHVCVNVSRRSSSSSDQKRTAPLLLPRQALTVALQRCRAAYSSYFPSARMR